jgi:hypothetical protein
MIGLLKRICKILDETEIPYMLSGSMAMNMYAEARTTQDIDIVVEMQASHVEKLKPFMDDKFYFYEEGVYQEIRRRGMFNIIDFESGAKVDFIIRNNLPFEKVKFDRRQQVDYLGIKIWVISPEDLVISKLQWIQELESERQKRDILNLLDTADINFAYVEHWIETLNLKTYNLF